MTRIRVPMGDQGESLSAVRSTFKAIHSLSPRIAATIEAAQRALYVDGKLPERLRELVRLRIGFHNQCRTCMAVRYAQGSVPESLVCALEAPQDASDLTAAEQAALEFADLFATDHLAIGEPTYERLRSYFDEGEIVELGFMCAIFVGTGRLAATWNVVESLPTDFREADGIVTPWGHAAVLGLKSEKAG